jgi:rare lipoprotein A
MMLNKPAVWLTMLLMSMALAGCTTPRPAAPVPPEPAETEAGTLIGSGKASYYGSQHHNKLTANGERFDQGALTAAHRTLPFGTKLRVINTRNDKSVVVRINDRGPFVHGRIIDLSKAAFEQIANTSTGVIRVRLERVD